MPFTLSHAAAALPLRRLKLEWSAFLIGSMAPDFPYIVGNTDYRSLGHAFPGVIEFTLPVSILALWVFHVAIKRPASTLLPKGVRQRLQGQLGAFKFGGPARFLAILFSIVLGIATHLAWDTLTHPLNWLWRRWAWMQKVVKFPVIGSVPMYEALQYGSSLIGLAALGIWVLLWYRKTAPAPLAGTANGNSGPLIALSMIAVATVAGFIRAELVIGTPKNLDMADSFLFVFGVTGIALAFWQVLIYCIMISSHQTWTLS
ncbi:MAG: DUF4184 family protein [Candidatus Korobacteraceae bacterium]